MKHKKAIHLVASPYIASRLAVDFQGNKEKHIISGLVSLYGER
ncbi:hypothetical protein [Niallia circulans]|nr:hypothetical protein [Niallia circulans]